MKWFPRHALTVLVAFAVLPFVMAHPVRAQQIRTTGTACTGPDFSSWEQSSLCPSGSSTWQRPAYQLGASTSQTCNAGLSGMLQWTGTAASPNNTFEYCNGTSWIALGGSTTPAAITFTNQTNVSTAQTATSNAVALSGTGPWTATCGTGCTSIARNGVWGGISMSGFVNGDTIAIRQLASAGLGAATTASVTVGSTTSGTWTVTTTNGCQVGITVGQACPDGTIYAGFSPDGTVPMYTTQCDAGQYWNGSACTVCASGLWSGSGSTCSTTYSSRTDGLVTWNNGTGNWTDTGYTSAVTGKDNTAGLAVLADAGSTYKAASYCENLTAYGNSDWYLPAKNELNILYTNAAAIGHFDVTDGSTVVSGGYPGLYWSSSEGSNNNAWYQRFSDGNQTNTFKNVFLSVRCARR